MAIKTMFSRINTPGAIQISTTSNKGIDKFKNKSSVEIICSYDSDPVTTYVRSKVWDVKLQNFIFPPYVECEYVI